MLIVNKLMGMRMSADSIFVQNFRPVQFVKNRTIFLANTACRLYSFLMGRRVAFILASIHEGSSVHMFRRSLSAFDIRKDALFVFPGGRLNYKPGNEYLRNSIYDLANRENFDGLVAWTSSLTGAAGVDEVSQFMSRYSGLPSVAVGLKVSPDIPVVDFDAYKGFYALVKHFITVHRKRRIAFLRGPENHESGQERYKAYLDALTDSGISIDYDLISSPTPWGEGRAALQELIVTRGLVPSLDFDALVCASDFMMLSAVRRLEELSVSIPHSVAVAGFNDSHTNKLLSVAPTTVRMPIDGMMDTAAEMIYAMMDGQERKEDVRLDSSLVIRRSCGCNDSFAGADEAAKVIYDAESFISWAIESSAGRLGREDLEYFVAYAQSLKDPSSVEKEIFLSRFSHICRIFFEKNGEAEDIAEVFHWFSLLLPLSDEMRAFCRTNLDRAVLDCYSRCTGKLEYSRIEQTDKVNHFKMALLGTRAMDALSDTMHTYLKELGFPQAYLVINDSEERQVLAAGYNSIADMVEKESFAAGLLLPERYRALTDSGVFVVEPLICDNEMAGHLILETGPSPDEALIEDVMASIASALKGITLLEEANNAKERAEKAERASNEFYANISEELREPLGSIRTALSLVKTSDTKDLVINNVEKAEHLLDLILMEKGEFEVHPAMLDTKAFLEEFARGRTFRSLSIPPVIPAVCTDREKLGQVLDILYSISAEAAGGQDADFSVSIGPNGTGVSFHVERWHPSLVRSNPSLQLAEQIVVLLSGSFHFKEHSIMISLPWPALSGAGPKTGYGAVLFIRTEKDFPVPVYLNAFNDVIVMDDSQLTGTLNLPANITQIAYDDSQKREHGTLALNLLHSHQATRDLPFLCTNLSAFGSDLWSGLCASQQLSGSPGGTGIFCLGALPEGLERLDAYCRHESFNTLDELFEAIDAPPAFIILNRCSPDDISRIRYGKLSSSSPVLIVKDSFTEEEVQAIEEFPSVLICNSGICTSDEFLSRLVGIFAGNPVLPPLTGALVKRAIVYLNSKARTHISRWKIADSVNISEDYLTRLFKKDMGLSPWDYLNRYRIQLARELLMTTGKSVNEIASETGFRDQAYFCRVYKKITGSAPRKNRKK